ncbi:Thermosome subunit gamma [Rhynchospora pubera]|uniref:Thermosome subunit gamma n=1 Tax=Rhynchospora pubera TaxID=906938 RepID=A0AAV8C5A0_9POAL|nr:Thermosome subunit gamma [Rhynchospora pubera]
MIFVSLSLAPNPHSSFCPKSLPSPCYYVNSQISRGARAIAHLKRHLAVVRRRSHLSATLNRGDDVAQKPLRDPFVRNQRKVRPWSLRPLQLQTQGIGEGHLAQLKQENNNVSHASKEMNGGNDALLSNFARYKRCSDVVDVAGELQTSIVSYKKMLPWRSINSRLQVDLVSTIHIADIRYYKILQERLASYDCVLYELVKLGDNSEQQRILEGELGMEREPNKEGYNIPFSILFLLFSSLDLFMQQDCLNMKGRNWYNADLDAKTIQRLEERRKTLLAAVGDAVGSAQKSDFGSSSVQFSSNSFRSKVPRGSKVVNRPLVLSLILFLMYSSPDEDEQHMDDFGHIFREVLELGIGSALKAFWARSLTSAKNRSASRIYRDPNRNSVIIGERNKAAMEELKRAISRGEKKIAILYGAWHMPDFDRRLRQEFKMVPTNVDWVTAWSIRRTKSKHSGPFGISLPYSLNKCRTLVCGSILCGILLLDFSLWWLLVVGVGCHLIWVFFTAVQISLAVQRQVNM